MISLPGWSQPVATWKGDDAYKRKDKEADIAGRTRGAAMTILGAEVRALASGALRKEELCWVALEQVAEVRPSDRMPERAGFSGPSSSPDMNACKRGRTLFRRADKHWLTARRHLTTGRVLWCQTVALSSLHHRSRHHHCCIRHHRIHPDRHSLLHRNHPVRHDQDPSNLPARLPQPVQ